MPNARPTEPDAEGGCRFSPSAVASADAIVDAVVVRPMARVANPSAVLKVLRHWKGRKVSTYVVEAPLGSCALEFNSTGDRVRVLLQRYEDQKGRAHWMATPNLNSGSTVYADGFDRAIDAILRDRRPADFVSLSEGPPR